MELNSLVEWTVIGLRTVMNLCNELEDTQ